MYEEEFGPPPKTMSIKQMRHIELLERVQQLPMNKNGSRDLILARFSRDQLISMLMP